MGAGKGAFTRQVEIDAPAELVWVVMENVEDWPDWTPTILDVDPMQSGGLAIGAQYRVKQPYLPGAVWRVTHVKRRSDFTWKTRGPGYVMSANHTVTPGDGKTTVKLALAIDGLLGRLIRVLCSSALRKALALEAAGLKEECERLHQTVRIWQPAAAPDW